MTNTQTQPHPTHSLWWLYFTVAAISCLLTAIELSLDNPVELDSLLYLKAAEVFNQQGYAAATAIYPWPFFSIAIASIHRLCHLSYLHAGYTVNTLLQTLITINFMRLIKALGGHKRIIYIAAIIIIFYPYLNKIRPYLTRDFGYWAFALWGILNLIQYEQQPRLRYILGWYCCLGIASLFRIEGVIFLLLGPLVYLLPSSKLLLKDRLLTIIRLYTPLLLLLSLGLFWKLLSMPPHVSSMGRLPELLLAMQQGLTLALHSINAKSLLVSRYILNNVAQDDAKWFLTGGLISLFIGVMVKTFNPVYLFLCGYGLRYRLLATTPFIQHLLIYFIFINILILSLFLGQQFFIVDRYVVFLNLILMLWIPFSVNRIIMRWQQPVPSVNQKWLLPLLILLFIGFATGGIIRFGYSKAYITDAGRWIKENTPLTAKLYSNSAQLLFYAERQDLKGQVYYLAPPELNSLKKTDLRQYHYLAIWQTKKDKVITLPCEQATLIKVFQNKRGDKILIYQTKNNAYSKESC